MKESVSIPRLIDHAPLGDLCLEAARLYQQDKRSLHGSVFVKLAKRLIQAEVRPGGPYRNSEGVVDLFTNLGVGYLFRCLSTPLPNVTVYIASNRNKDPRPTELSALLKKYDGLTTLPTLPAQPAQYTKILTKVAMELSLLNEPAKTSALEFLDRIKRADKNHEIAFLPTFFAKSLKKPPIALPLAALGEANVCCWIAYTIYDHILDGEPTISSLPIANIVMRLSLSKYQAQLPSGQRRINDIFTAMDQANAWEIANCRFKLEDAKIHISPLPDYGQYTVLADRSHGHVLGPLIITELAHLSATSQASIEKGLRHYLIARQLSDDAHDWKEDIRAGHCSAVVACLLRSCQVSAGVHALETLIDQMQSDFWDRSLKAVNDTIQKHIALAHRFFAESGVMKEAGPLFTLLSQLDNAAIWSNFEHERYKDFAATYRKLS